MTFDLKLEETSLDELRSLCCVYGIPAATELHTKLTADSHCDNFRPVKWRI